LKRTCSFIWTNVNSLHQMIIEHLWYCGSWEETIYMILPYFCTFVIIPPSKRTWAFIWILLNSHHARYVSTKSDWPAGSGEDFFSINGFPYCGPSRPPGTMISRKLNLHYISKLSCKYDLFWLSGSGEENF
jgi:hypothetical protein